MVLYRAGYDFKRLFTISEYYDRDRSAFYRAIQGVREESMDLTGWLEFFVSGLATQLDEVKARGEIAIRTDLVARARRLDPRQAGALDHLLAHGKLALGELESLFPDVNRRTLQRDLKSYARQRAAPGGGHGTDRPQSPVCTWGAVTSYDMELCQAVTPEL